MNRWACAGIGLLIAGMSGCSDRLAEIQQKLQGSWVLESRRLADGQMLTSPRVSGVLSWVPIDSRKAHVTVNVLVNEGDGVPRTFDYAASTYEISTSAITRNRHVLIRQGYRSSAAAPITVYPKARTAKGKISVEDGVVKISHEEGFSQVFESDTMTSTFTDTFTDTWRRVP